MRRASEETFNPIATEMAIRVPAYEPGPSPTIMISGTPNLFVTMFKFSKNGAEFLRSFGHLRANSTASLSRARLPRAVESSSARIFILR